jgi:hypothetical protein
MLAPKGSSTLHKYCRARVAYATVQRLLGASPGGGELTAATWHARRKH